MDDSKLSPCATKVTLFTLFFLLGFASRASLTRQKHYVLPKWIPKLHCNTFSVDTTPAVNIHFICHPFYLDYKLYRWNTWKSIFTKHCPFILSVDDRFSDRQQALCVAGTIFVRPSSLSVQEQHRNVVLPSPPLSAQHTIFSIIFIDRFAVGGLITNLVCLCRLPVQRVSDHTYNRCNEDTLPNAYLYLKSMGQLSLNSCIFNLKPL